MLHSVLSVVTRWQSAAIVSAAGGSTPKGAEAAQQAAEGSSEKTSAERRGQLGDQIKKRNAKYHQV